jgi:hypothetical protein
MSRRGVAILLVLVVLVVAVTAAVNVARVSVAGMTAHRLADDTRLADDLLIQAETAAHTWLGSSSSTVVLPPDRDRPSLTVLDDVVMFGDRSCSMTVTAVDLLGMPGLHNAEAFSMSLPAEVADSIGALDGDADGIGPDMVDRASVDGPVYPIPNRGEPVVYGDAMSGGRSWSIDQQTTTEAELNGPPSVCELVAFLGISPPRRLVREQADEQPHPININTAPIPLLESVLSRSGLDAIDGIIEARTEGRPATLNLTLDEDSTVRLVTRSTLWGFRCDVRTGSVFRSHWVVFEQTGGVWRLVRRIVIDA